MKVPILLAVVALAAVAQQASALGSDSWFSAETDFSISFGGDATTSMTLGMNYGLNVSGAYNFIPPPSTAGDGVNPYNSTSNNFDSVSRTGYVSAGCESSTASDGTASNSQGRNYYFTITNTSASLTGTFTISVGLIQQSLFAAGDAQTNAYGGVQEYIPGVGYPSGFFQSQLFGNGSNSYLSGGAFSEGAGSTPTHYTASGSLGDTLAPGQVVGIQIWASGSTYANTRVVPEPVTMGLGVAGIALFLRRRRKQA